MIDTAKLINFFKKKIDYFVGVPDSVLKNFSNHLENSKEKKHIVSTNEGSAVALAIGRYLAKKKGCVINNMIKKQNVEYINKHVKELKASCNKKKCYKIY